MDGKTLAIIIAVCIIIIIIIIIIAAMVTAPPARGSTRGFPRSAAQDIADRGVSSPHQDVSQLPTKIPCILERRVGDGVTLHCTQHNSIHECKLANCKLFEGQCILRTVPGHMCNFALQPSGGPSAQPGVVPDIHLSSHMAPEAPQPGAASPYWPPGVAASPQSYLPGSDTHPVNAALALGAYPPGVVLPYKAHPLEAYLPGTFSPPGAYPPGAYPASAALPPGTYPPGTIPPAGAYPASAALPPGTYPPGTIPPAGTAPSAGAYPPGTAPPDAALPPAATARDAPNISAVNSYLLGDSTGDVRISRAPGARFTNDYVVGSDASSVSDDESKELEAKSGSSTADSSQESSPFVSKDDARVMKASKHRFLDVCSFGKAIIALYERGMVKHQDGKNTRITCNVPLTQIGQLGNSLYGLSNGSLYTPRANTMKTNKWLWEVVRWAPMGITYINTTLSTSHMWIQASGKAYLYTMMLTLEGECSWPNPGIIRVYGVDQNKYIDIDRVKCTGVSQPGHQRYTDICFGVITEDGKVHPIKAAYRDKYTNIRIVARKPYYITA